MPQPTQPQEMPQPTQPQEKANQSQEIPQSTRPEPIPQLIKVPANDIKKAEEIIDGFDIARVMKDKLENVASTPDQL